MRIVRTSLVVMAGLTLAACASAGGRSGPASPEAVARLERDHAANPKSESVARALGIAYYKSQRYRDARRVLDQAAQLDPRDGAVQLYLGLAAEQQNDFAAARSAYSSYMQFGRTRRVRRELEAHLAALTRKEMQVAAKTAIAQETQLGAQPGSPNTVAVMPLVFTGADTSLKPLERGMADLLVTDLARSPKLVVVERERIQALLDEMKLQASDASDPATRVRTGKLLRAGRVVQGSIAQQGDALRVDAGVIDVPTTQLTGTTNDQRALDQLFTLEKNIALGLFDKLGVTLTVAERNEIEQRPTRSLSAFLAYSRGLMFEDAGRYDEAARMFQDAVRIDPGFSRASDKARQAQQAAIGLSVSTNTIESGLNGSSEGQIAQQAAAGNATSGNGSTAATTADGLNPPLVGAAATGGSVSSSTAAGQKNASDGTQSTDPGSSSGKIVIIIPRP